MIKKYLTITGSKSFIGDKLFTEYLNLPGYQVNSYDSRNWKKGVVRARLLKKTYSELLFKSLTVNINYKHLIIHCEEIVDTNNSSESDILMSNIEITKQLAEYARLNDVRVIFVSSLQAKDPKNIYAWSKLIAEHFLKLILPKENLVILRFANIYGDNEHRYKNENARSIIWKLQNNTLSVIYEYCERDFIHIKDVINALKIVIENNRISGTYDVGPCEPISISDLAKKIGNNTHLPVTELPSTVACRLVANRNNWLPEWAPAYSNLERLTSHQNFIDPEPIVLGLH